MENRKLVVLMVMLGFILISPASQAYTSETHAFLTKETIDFLEKKMSGIKIESNLKDFLVDGARREDDPPRWMNHFYDPTKNRGLSFDPAINPGIDIGNWTKSKDWANDWKKQSGLLYSPVIATMLSFVQEGKIQKFFPTSDFTFDEAIRYWVNGEKEMAMFSLGHVIHLTQDTSVPDHTRNDYHPGDSPYENYASKFSLSAPDYQLKQKLSGETPIILPNLDNYFDGLARYSNENFYSKDTIGIQSGYNLPTPQNSIIIKNKTILTKDDIYLARSLVKNSYLPIIANKNSITIEDEDVQKNNWSLLSAKSIEYGSGVISLFFKEVEKARANPDLVKKKNKPFLAQVIETTGNLLGQIGSKISGAYFLAKDFINENLGKKDGFSKVAEIPQEKNLSQKETPNSQKQVITKNNTNQNPSTSKTTITTSKKTENTTTKKDTQNKNEKEVKTTEKKDEKKKETSFCQFEIFSQPQRTSLIINEVAWMGTTESSSNEWIELKNISSDRINISEWQLIGSKNDIQIDLSQIKNKEIPSQGFVLLERTDDDSVSEIKGDLVYSGSLSNSGDGLRLFSSNCTPEDQVIAQPEWPSGESSSRRTMERRNDLSWQSSSAINGTPKRENSGGYITPSVAYHPPATNQNQNATTTSTTTPTSSTSTSTSTTSTSTTGTEPRFFPIIINEIMYNPEGADDEREWLEIKNNGTSSVDISTWKFRQGETNHGLTIFSGNSIISPQEYAIISQKPQKFLEDFPNFSGTIFDSSFSLKNTGEELSLKNGDLEIHKVFYQPQEYSDGKGNSLQLIGEEWKDGPPTPGKNNQERTANPNEPQIQPLDHLVISEVQIKGDEPSDEFIEIYNPTENQISFEGYSIQYISGKAENFENVYKKNFDQEKIIKPLSFFLLTNSDSKYSNIADLSYDFSLSGESSGGILVLSKTSSSTENLSDSNIVDYISYGDPKIENLDPIEEIEKNQSIERKSIKDGYCYTSQNKGEFLGNACDTNTKNDFEKRDAPNPQNSSNLPEPRNAPEKPENFNASFNKPTMEILFSWGNKGWSNEINYKINEQFKNKKDGLIKEGILGSLVVDKILIKEIGVKRSFSILACDKDNLCSESENSEVEIPTFFSKLNFFKEKKDGVERYFIEAYYDQRYFIPTGSNAEWNLIDFYLNSKAEDGTASISIKYQSCSGSEGYFGSLMTADIKERCNNSGGAYSQSTMLSEEDNYFVFEVDPSSKPSFNPNDEKNYITISFQTSQGTMPSDGRIPYFKMVAIDNNEYELKDISEVEHEAPQFKGEITKEFDEANSRLKLSWPQAEDIDTEDSKITYEIKKNIDEEWTSVGSVKNEAIIASPGDYFEIKLRAKDAFGVYSDILETDWLYPETEMYIVQDLPGSWSWLFGTDASGASLQTIKPLEDIRVNKISVRLKKDKTGDLGNVRLSILEDKENMPDWNNKLGQSYINDIYTPNSDTDYTFTFSPYVQLNKDKTYWLALDVPSYSDFRGPTRNEWRNATNQQGDRYLEGACGIGAVNNIKDGPAQTFSFPYPSSECDWYMKIGYQP